MKRLFFLIPVVGLFLFFASCNPREKVPHEFPDRAEMADILADLYLSENMTTPGSDEVSHMSGREMFPGYYKNVLDKYNLSTEKFDTIRKWYVAHPYHFQEVYEKVIVILNQREAEIKKQMAAEREKKKDEKRDLWEGPRDFTAGGSDSISQRFPFYVSIDSLQKGTFRLSAYYKLLKEDMTRQARMVLVMHYNDSTADTVDCEVPLSFQKKVASLSCPMDTSKIGLGVSGYLFDHDTTAVTSVEITDIRLRYFRGDESFLKLKLDEDL